MENAQIADANEEVGDQNATPKLTGYPKLARMMSMSSETAILRRFGRLNMLNLLRLQAELHSLEHDLQEIMDEDTASQDAIRVDYVNDFQLMRDFVESGDSLYHDKLCEIGKKIEEYNQAFQHAKDLQEAQVPTKREVKFLQNWLIRPAMGNDFLKDRERTIWEDDNIPDLVTLHPRPREMDIFTSSLNGVLLDLYHRVFGRRREQRNTTFLGENIAEYREEKILAFSNIIGAMLSSLLPTVAILVLFFIKRMLIRIGLVILFTAIFSVTLSLVTQARKVEVFSATAAFAAVEVVFIGSTSMNTTGS